MKLLAPLALILTAIALIIPAQGATNIYIDKDFVNLGESVRIQVSIDEAINKPFEILVICQENAYKLCEGEGGNLTSACGTTEWLFEIPENWKDGTCLVKVLVDDAEPIEYFEEFEVVKPKILDLEIPELVYQGKTRIKATLETANSSETFLELRILGKNADVVAVKNLEFANKTDDTEYEVSIELNLRQGYELSHDISDVIQPGSYLMEVLLEFGGRVWDSRSVVVRISKPTLKVVVSDEITLGNPIVVRIKSNRVYDYGYDGILVTLVGTNYVVAKKAYLDNDGRAAVQFESAGLSEGKYEIYVRDTSLTTTISAKTLAVDNYDLDPNYSYSKILQANDDVLVKKEIWLISGSEEGMEYVRLHFNPRSYEVPPNSTVSFNIIVDSERVSSYKFSVSLAMPEEVAEIVSVGLPDWASTIDRHVSTSYAMLHAANFGNGTEIGKNLTLATLTLHTKKPGVVVLNIHDAKVYRSDGKPLNLKTYGAYLTVSEERAAVEEENIKGSNENSPAASTLAEKTEYGATTTTVTQVESNVQTMPEQETTLDYQKVVMFTGIFFAIFSAVKYLMRKPLAGKRKSS